ncbi:MAG: hypothetical protein ACKVRO_04645 [Micropepsaceae bacterium]
MSRTLAHITALTALALSAAVWPAAADTIRVSGGCEASDRIPNSQWTTCAARADTTFTFNAAGVGTMYALRIAAPSTHCSAVNYQVWSVTDRNRMFGKTRRFLGAGENEIVNIGNDFPPGNQTVAIRVLGQMGGCNEGRMESWAAFVELVVIP